MQAAGWTAFGPARVEVKQLRQRLAVLRLPDVVGVEVRAAIHQHEGFGLARGIKQLAPQFGHDQLVVRSVHHQQGRANPGDFAHRLKALRDQRTDGQPAPFHAAGHVGNGREGAFNNGAGFVFHLRCQLNGNGTAQ